MITTKYWLGNPSYFLFYVDVDKGEFTQVVTLVVPLKMVQIFRRTSGGMPKSSTFSSGETAMTNDNADLTMPLYQVHPWPIYWKSVLLFVTAPCWRKRSVRLRFSVVFHHWNCET